MNIYAGTLGQLVIVEVFVFFIWVRVLLDAVKAKDNTLAAKRLLLTSIGLVFNAAAITGIMVMRIWELVTNNWPFVWGIVAFYILLAAGNILFIVSACLGRNTKLLQAFLVATFIWTAYVVYATYF
jgi:hypothetical protein